MSSNRNSLAEITKDVNQTVSRTKRKSEEAFSSENNLCKKSPLKSSNQENILNNNTENCPKRHKRHKSNEVQNENENFELTPCSTIATSCRAAPLQPLTPLPNFSWSNPEEVWKMMLKNEQLYQRDSSLFSQQPSLQPVMRAMLLDWLNEVCQAYSLSRQTYYLALDFFDRYLSTRADVSKKHLQLLGITCLFIAAKIEEIFPPKLDRFSFVCDGACDDTEILAKEQLVLNTLKWELCPVTPIAWLNVFMQVYSSIDKENASANEDGEHFLFPDYDSKLFVQIAHLIDLCTLNAGSLTYSYSVIAASAFYHFTNETVVLQCTGKSMSELSSCIEWMIPFAIAIKNEGLDFVYKLLVDEEKCTTVQSHTVSLDLLKSANGIQSELESDKMSTLLESSDYSSCPSSMTPSKMPLTPPRSRSQ